MNSQDTSPNELPDKQLIANDLEHKVFAWDETYRSLLYEIGHQINNLRRKGEEIKKFLSPNAISPTDLREVGLLLGGVDDLCKSLKGEITKIETLVDVILKISMKCPDIIGTQKYVIGMEGFWSPEGTVDHVSNSDLIKKTFYYFKEKELIELVNIVKPFLQDAPTGKEDQHKIKIEMLLDSLISHLLLFLKSELVYVPFIEKTLLLLKWEEISEKIAKWISPFELLKTQDFFAQHILHAMWGFQRLAQTKEYSLNATVKVEGILGPKKETQAILDLVTALLR